MRLGRFFSAVWALLRQYGLTAALFLTMAWITVGGLTGASQASQAEQLRLAAQAVRRAAVNCYAVEGFYPDSYTYLRDNYGVRVDETKFAVHYEAFGQNLMPDVTITEVSP